MAHWYKFQIDPSTFIVCKAARKAEIEKELPIKVQFTGCVALEKIEALRSLNNTVVLNSVAQLRSILPHIPALA